MKDPRFSECHAENWMPGNINDASFVNGDDRQLLLKLLVEVMRINFESVQLTLKDQLGMVSVVTFCILIFRCN